MEIPTLAEIWNAIIEILKNNQFAQGGFLISFLVALPRYIIPFFTRLYQRIARLVVYHVNIEETDDLFIYFEYWLSKHYTQKYRNVEAAICLSKEGYNPIKDDCENVFVEEITYKQFDDVFYLRTGRFSWVRVDKGREKLENANNMRQAFYNKFRISGVFAKKRINKLLDDVLKYAQEETKKNKEKTIRVKSSTAYGDWIDESVVDPKPMDKIILQGKGELLADIDNFLGNREWYTKHNILYKRGYMFTGVAGTGKTSFTMSLAKRLKRTINFLQINNIDDSGIRAAFRHLKPDSILVIEDIDAAFKKRDDGKAGVKFTFSTLLNCLDGVFSKEDIIVIFTTNHPELLDSALIRKGRIDFIMEFKRPSHIEVNQYMSEFYEKEMEYVGEHYNGLLPMVTVQDICLQNSDNFEKAIIQLFNESEAIVEQGDVIDYSESNFNGEIDEDFNKPEQVEPRSIR